MENSSLTLYLEINNLNYIFFVAEKDEQNNFKITYKLEIPLRGLENDRIFDLEIVSNIIKENIYLIEQKLKYTFKEVVLVLETFNPSFINLTGYKKLNGSQILKENITYILNTLKSYVNEIEHKKKVLHIFNSNYYLDFKKIENLPIGLFGDFYSHELAFNLINMNDYNNLKNIFENCNLKINKILLKTFIKGANTSDTKNIETFFQIQLNKDHSKIFFFENNTLRFEQRFKFGTDIIIKDISKITSLKLDTVKEILDKIELKKEILDDDLIPKAHFNHDPYRKIKKKLIHEIALARIKEISDIIIFKNINLKYFNKINKILFIELNCKLQSRNFKEIYRNIFSFNNFDVNFLDNLSSNNMLKTANKLVHFGWKKEAIPVSISKKSILARFFDNMFG